MTREELHALHEHWYEGGTLNNDQISAVLVLALDAFPKADRQVRSSKAQGEEQALALLREAHTFLNAQAFTQEEIDDFCKRLDAYFGIPSDSHSPQEERK